MREYLGICLFLWALAFGTWYLIAHSTGEEDRGAARLVSVNSMPKLGAVAYCSDQMDTVLAMADVLLKAGGPEVPTALRSDVENCLSFDAKSRSRMDETQLIRLFPKG